MPKETNTIVPKTAFVLTPLINRCIMLTFGFTLSLIPLTFPSTVVLCIYIYLYSTSLRCEIKLYIFKILFYLILYFSIYACLFLCLQLCCVFYFAMSCLKTTIKVHYIKPLLQRIFQKLVIIYIFLCIKHTYIHIYIIYIYVCVRI